MAPARFWLRYQRSPGIAGSSELGFCIQIGAQLARAIFRTLTNGMSLFYSVQGDHTYTFNFAFSMQEPTIHRVYGRLNESLAL